MSTIHLKGKQGHQTQVTKWWLKHGKKEGERRNFTHVGVKEKSQESKDP